MSTFPPLDENPFNKFSNDWLLEAQVAITYGCLRSKAALSKRHHKYVCALQQILDDQADARASEKPHFPYPPPDHAPEA